MMARKETNMGREKGAKTELDRPRFQVKDLHPASSLGESETDEVSPNGGSDSSSDAKRYNYITAWPRK